MSEIKLVSYKTKTGVGKDYMKRLYRFWGKKN